MKDKISNKLIPEVMQRSDKDFFVILWEKIQTKI